MGDSMVPMYIYHQFRIHAQYFLTFPKQQDTNSSTKIHNLAISLTIHYVFKTFLPVGHGKWQDMKKFGTMLRMYYSAKA